MPLKEGLFLTLANKNDFGDGNGILSLEVPILV